MPRSPAAQSPGGRLNSAWVRPFAEPLGDGLGRVLVGEQELDGLEAGVGRRLEAVEERHIR